ncbi:G-protein coupled receptor GRL101-like [Saccostrea cucullata]|uniref:G-protein coupled receptor GRL101-like n=1 Tax=Saccostrea cuccullata TaxID=36930 RepID=UPI002ED527BA
MDKNTSALTSNCSKSSKISYINCTQGQLVEEMVPPQNDSQRVCEKKQNNSSDCKGNSNIMSSDSITCSSCVEIGLSNSCKPNSQSSVTCHPFCPEACNCSGKSYICVRDHCPAYTEKLVLQNVRCGTLELDDYHGERYFLQSRHIFKLEICNSFITELKVYQYDRLSLHKIIIMHSTVDKIYVDSLGNRIVYEALHSLHVFNSSVSDLEFEDSRMVTSMNATYYIRNVKFNYKPEIYDISGNSFEDFERSYFNVRDMLNASYNAFTKMPKISGCRIVDVSFNRLTSYEHSAAGTHVLFLNNNNLKSVRRANYDPKVGTSLRILDISYNDVTVVNAGELLAANLIFLNLSNNIIHSIHFEAFVGTPQLTSLDLSHNNISAITAGTFLPLKNLEELYLQENSFQVTLGMFIGLSSLRWMEVSHFTICCAKPNSRYDVQCIAPVNAISSCKNLIAVLVLNVSIWYIALIAAFGNIAVLIFNVEKSKGKKEEAYYILAFNSACADFLMGVYLFIIAFINLHYTGQYGMNDYVWRNSYMCTLAGIMATLSSEVSAFILLFFTLDRLIIVKYPFSDARLTKRKAYLLMPTVWMLSSFLSLFPLIPNTGLENFYAQSGICVSLPLSVDRRPGWEYSMIEFVGINFLLFLGILVGQIFVEVICVGRNVRSTKTRQREASLAMTLFVIVITDVFCWIPIGILRMLTFWEIEVSPEVYGWMVVVVMPINSAINPILYTLSSVIRKKRMENWENSSELKKQLCTLKLRLENTRDRTISTVSDKLSDNPDLHDCPTLRIRDVKEQMGTEDSKEAQNEDSSM